MLHRINWLSYDLTKPTRKSIHVRSIKTLKLVFAVLKTKYSLPTAAAAVPANSSSFQGSLLWRLRPTIGVRIVFSRPTLGRACRQTCYDLTFAQQSCAGCRTIRRDTQDFWSKKKKKKIKTVTRTFGVGHCLQWVVIFV